MKSIDSPLPRDDDAPSPTDAAPTIPAASSGAPAGTEAPPAHHSRSLQRVRNLFVRLPAIAIARRLAANYGTWNAAIVTGVLFVVFIGLVEYLLPPINEVPENFSAMVLWRFRTTSLGMHVILWSVLGLAFGALAEKRLGLKSGLRPAYR